MMLLCPWDSPARILNWVAMPSSRGSSWSRDQPCISYACCIGRWVGSLLVVSPWNTFQYSCLENSMDRGAYWETDQGLQRIEHTWVANTFYGLVLVFSHRIGLGGSKIWDWGSLVARSVYWMLVPECEIIDTLQISDCLSCKGKKWNHKMTTGSNLTPVDRIQLRVTRLSKWKYKMSS